MTQASPLPAPGLTAEVVSAATLWREAPQTCGCGLHGQLLVGLSWFERLHAKPQRFSSKKVET